MFVVFVLFVVFVCVVFVCVVFVCFFATNSNSELLYLPPASNATSTIPHDHTSAGSAW